jgi:haloacetate dehalogenase
MFKGFEQHRITTSGAEINCRIGGNGPPLLLLHGYPQTHAMWHKIADRLAERYTVVVSDLRGYGDGSKPESDQTHTPYSKRQMALDQVEVMEQLGFREFYLAGHDRGARVAHRLTLDHPVRVKKLAVLDIAPTLAMYRKTDDEFARAYYHWFFLIQPAPYPERLIGADPDYFLRTKCGLLGGGIKHFSDAALLEYLRCFNDEATIHATCEDYRAAATIDLDHDEADLDRKIECPVLVLWGAKGVIERCFDALAEWRERASDVQGRNLPAGHYLAEELPDETASEFEAFFTE